MKRGRQVQTDPLFRKICRKAGVTIRDHGMITSGDHILVGVSGGKDSMILLQVLAERKASLPFDFEITAAHISAETVDYRIDLHALRDFCAAMNVEFIERIIKPDITYDSKKAPCFICSWHRRKELFKLTKQLNCNKLAFGHHRKDALETLLMNMIYHGSISSLPYSLYMFDKRIQLIRPLLDIEEGLLDDYAKSDRLVVVEKTCEYDSQNQREKMANLLSDIERIHGKGPFNMFKSMAKVCEEYLPKTKPGSLKDPGSSP